MKKNLIIVGSRGYQFKYGGWETFVTNFVDYSNDEFNLPRNINCAVFYRHVFLTIDGMAEVAANVKRSLANEFCMTLTVETALRIGIKCSVCQCVGCAVGNTYLDALAILDVNSCRVRISQCEVVEDDCCLITAFQEELAIG